MKNHCNFWKSLAFTLLCFTVLISGCSTKAPKKKDGPPKHIPANLLKTPNAVPKVEPLSRYGNRFGKNGKTNSYVALNKRYHVRPTSRGYRARGRASWYGTQFHGRKTSSGEPYNMFAMTAAHTSLPLPTYAKVTNLENGKSVVVKINDRGPFHADRIIDLSYVAAAKLGVLGGGTAHVEVVSIDPRDNPQHRAKSQRFKNTQTVESEHTTKKKTATYSATQGYKSNSYQKTVTKIQKIPSKTRPPSKTGATTLNKKKTIAKKVSVPSKRPAKTNLSSVSTFTANFNGTMIPLQYLA